MVDCLMPSNLERALAFQIRAKGLPKPVTEYQAIPGRKYRFDFAWPLPGWQALLVEVQGGVWGKHGKGGASAHSGGVAANRDAEKLNLAILAGWRVLHVTGDQIASGEAIRWIEAALALK